MFDTVGLLFKTANMLAQVEAAPDDSAAQYVVMGIISAIILVLVIRSQIERFRRQRSRRQPDEPNAGRSAAQIEAEARRAFEIPHVTVGDEEATRDRGFARARGIASCDSLDAI